MVHITVMYIVILYHNNNNNMNLLTCPEENSDLGTAVQPVFVLQFRPHVEMLNQY